MTTNLNLSDQVIQDVLEPLRNGIADPRHEPDVLSVFDKQSCLATRTLQQQFRSFFRSVQRGQFPLPDPAGYRRQGPWSATAEIEMDALPYEATGMPARRSVQMRFQLKLDPKGWKIVELQPADFFSARI